jgi:hypothetical protein
LEKNVVTTIFTRTRRVLTVALFGLALLATMAGTAHARAAASLTLPTAVHIPANKGPLLSLKAGPALNGNAGVFEAFEDPTQPTPENMQFIALPYDGDKTFMLCSVSVSKSIGGPFGIACLDIINDSTAPGAHLKIAPFQDHPSQRWVIENKDPVRPQTLTIRSAWSGLYLDTGADPKSGDRPTQQPFQQGPAQQWFIKPAKN